jgi:SAM-dependent methyltransferase
MDADTRRLADAVLLGSMYTYAAGVLYPAQACKHAGIPVVGPPIGEPPVAPTRPGLGPFFSTSHPDPVLDDTAGDSEEQSHEFDRMSDQYADLVAFFSVPIFHEALAVMRQWIDPAARVLDAGCGPGRELRQVAALVPLGEVVGIDLSAGMVRQAHRLAHEKGVRNVAFVQANAAAPPASFRGQFDLVFSCLAHHHYANPRAVSEAVASCLREGGIYCVVDPGPAWYNNLAEPLARWADPGFAGYHTPTQFADLFRSAGFSRTSWYELLPGFGLAVGQKRATVA